MFTKFAVLTFALAACVSEPRPSARAPRIVSIDAHSESAAAAIADAARTGADGIDIWFKSDKTEEGMPRWTEDYERVADIADHSGFRSSDGPASTRYWNISVDRRFRSPQSAFDACVGDWEVRDFIYPLLVRGIPFSVNYSGATWDVRVPVQLLSDVKGKRYDHAGK